MQTIAVSVCFLVVSHGMLCGFCSLLAIDVDIHKAVPLVPLPDADVIIFSIENTHSIAGQSECHDAVMTGTWMSGYIGSILWYRPV